MQVPPTEIIFYSAIFSTLRYKDCPETQIPNHQS